MRRLSILVSGLILVSCVDQQTQKALFQKFIPKDDDTFARHFIDLLREGRYEQVDEVLDPAIAAQAGATGLAQLHQMIDRGQPVAFDNVGYDVVTVAGPQKKRTVSLTYQLQFRDAWILANVVLDSKTGGNRVLGIHLTPIPDSLEVINRFTFQNKSVIHYVTIALCLAIPLFIVTVAVVCLCSRVRRRRWLWIIFILFGIMQFQLNWTTGQWAIQPISVSFLGAGCFRPGPYAAWLLKFSIPVGAIVFLILRRRLGRDDPASSPTPPTPVPPSPPHDY